MMKLSYTIICGLQEVGQNFIENFLGKGGGDLSKFKYSGATTKIQGGCEPPVQAMHLYYV